MPVTQTYPASRYEVAPLIDLSDRTERERLSADAVRAFFNIMVHWKIRDDDARRLLGGMSNGAYYALKKGAPVHSTRTSFSGSPISSASSRR